MLLEFARHEAAFGTDEMQHLDNMPVAGKRAARGEHHRQHHGRENEDEDADADHDCSSGHGDQPVDPGAVIVEKCLRDFRFQHIPHGLEIGRIAFIDGDDDETRNGKFGKVETAAEPWFQQARCRCIVEDRAIPRADKGERQITRLVQCRIHVQPVLGLDLNGDLAGNLALPGGGGGAHHGDGAERQTGKEGHDGDHHHQRIALNVGGRQDGRHGADAHGRALRLRGFRFQLFAVDLIHRYRAALR
ncbi:hypothetical protein D3C86_1232670 [compost metagenome]